jgi:hypothetical protein
MATSGSTNFSVDRDTIISRALRIIGVIPQGVTPTATQVTEAANALNGLVKSLEADGMPLWGIRQYSLTMVASTRSYRFGEGQTINTPKPLKVISAYRRHTSSQTDTPMIILTRDEYDRLGNKFTTGTPIQIYYDPQRIYGDLFLFPVPNAASATGYTIEITFQRPFEDFDAATDEPDFPQEWFDALTFMLADRLALEYGVNEEVRADLVKRAMQYRAEALSFGTEEGSMYFTPDWRNW